MSNQINILNFLFCYRIRIFQLFVYSIISIIASRNKQDSPSSPKDYSIKDYSYNVCPTEALLDILIDIDGVKLNSDKVVGTKEVILSFLVWTI